MDVWQFTVDMTRYNTSHSYTGSKTSNIQQMKSMRQNPNKLQLR